MVAQNNPNLYPEIQEEGCYFLALLFVVEKMTGPYWRPQDVNTFYEKAVGKGYMEKDCYINSPKSILNIHGLNVKNIRKEPTSYLPTENEIEILFYQFKDYGHFVVGDNTGHVLWDSFGISNTVAHGVQVSKRIIDFGRPITWGNR